MVHRAADDGPVRLRRSGFYYTPYVTNRAALDDGSATSPGQLAEVDKRLATTALPGDEGRPWAPAEALNS